MNNNFAVYIRGPYPLGHGQMLSREPFGTGQWNWWMSAHAHPHLRKQRKGMRSICASGGHVHLLLTNGVHVHACWPLVEPFPPPIRKAGKVGELLASLPHGLISVPNIHPPTELENKIFNISCC